MSQSLAQLYVHIVFSTKHREHNLIPSIQTELNAYMGGILNNIECSPIQIGGMTDHLHVLCCLSKKITLIKMIEEIKRSSSKWIKTKGESFINFHWQDGYGAFSVGYTQIEEVTKYILNQNEHHKKISFQDEFIKFLKKYNINYDEKYIWD
jgi:putative transposase